MASLPRIACVDVPALPLQLTRRAHPEWRGHSVVVVDRDSPRGVVLWANERARKHGVLPGLRYAAGLSLDAELRAIEHAPTAIPAALGEIATLLRRYTPSVEPSPPDEEPGIFWLDAGGMSLLYPTLAAWAAAIRATLAEVKLTAAVVVGHSRYTCYATVRALAGRGQRVWDHPDDEKRAADRVPLTRIGIDPKDRELLAQLGVCVLGQLAQLPEAGLSRRFGRDTLRLRRLASGALTEPLSPVAPEEPLTLRCDFDDPLVDRQALLFFGKQLLDPLLVKLAARGEALKEMTLCFAVDTGVDGTRGGTSAPLVEELRPAVPTLDAPQLLGLLRLRLELSAISAGVRGMSLVVHGHPATREQLQLFFDAAAQPKRDLAAGARALARVRAALGDDAVVRAVLRPGHLPEASFAWEPLDRLPTAQPHRVAERPLVRRVLSRPEALPVRPAREPDGWLLRGFADGAVEQLTGPFVLSGGWWNTELRRDYYYAELARGALYWIYYDRRRRRWFLHGEAA